MADWDAVDGDYDRFLEILINRRAELPDVAERRHATTWNVAPDKPL